MIFSPGYLIGISGLFFCMVFYSCAASPAKMQPSKLEQTMTVARISAAKDNFIQVAFLQSQRFYKLPNDADPSFLVLLKESEKNNSPVMVTRADEYSDIILMVKNVSPGH